MPPLLMGALLSLTSALTGELSPARVLEKLLVLSFEGDLDFFGLRLLTPLCPIFSPCFEIIELQV